MRVLHLFSNHKVTGPAELALETVRALVDQGVPAALFSSDPRRTRYRERWLHQLALERGVPTEDVPGVRLPKHVHPLRVLFDVSRLAAHLRRDPPALVHCHLPGDHFVAWRALRRARLELPLVRTVYDGEPPPPTRRNRGMLAATQRVICHGEAVGRALAADAAFGLAERVRYVPPPIDTVRFDPARVDPGAPPARRAALGVPADAVCLGIVARMQTHRRFELLLEAFRAARAAAPALHLVVVGRGTHQDAVAREPVRALGLEDAVHFAGYVAGEDYVATLASFDAKVFMVPGSDGTCRAVREALAMGLPVIATPRGMLPELVRHETDGLIVEEEPAALEAAFLRVARDAAARAAWSAAARAGAVERFAYPAFAARLRAIYAELGVTPAEDSPPLGG
ncbi:MAG: glycosyltransferase family 4 protein [Planctomycetota bacterium]